MTKLDRLKKELKLARQKFDAAGGRGVDLADEIDDLEIRIEVEKLRSRWVSKRILRKALKGVVTHFWSKEFEDWENQRRENQLPLRKHILSDLIIIEAMLDQDSRISKPKKGRS